MNPPSNEYEKTVLFHIPWQVMLAMLIYPFVVPSAIVSPRKKMPEKNEREGGILCIGTGKLHPR